VGWIAEGGRKRVIDGSGKGGVEGGQIGQEVWSESAGERDGEPKPRKRTPRRDGAEKLRWAADWQLGKNSKELADALAKRALKGDLPSTKALVELADKKKPAEKRRHPSLGLLLEALPQWEEEDEDEDEDEEPVKPVMEEGGTGI
jgi:hypothetical protein